MRSVFSKAIVRPPSRTFAEGLTTAGLGAPDYHRALEQHAAYVAALEECGLELIRLEADERHPDSCFVEDAAVIAESSADYADSKSDDLRAARRQAILTRSGAPSRQEEVVSMRSELARLFPSLCEIRSPGTLDGGDVCEAGPHFFIGISERTNEDGARELAEILTTYGYTSSFVDIRTHARDARATHAQAARATQAQDARATARATSLLHLKSGVAYLRDKTLVITDTLAYREEFHEYDLLRVEPGEEYAANCIEVNGRVLIAAGHPHFAKKLCELGYETMELEMSEFQKMDGGLSCLSIRW